MLLFDYWLRLVDLGIINMIIVLSLSLYFSFNFFFIIISEEQLIHMGPPLILLVYEESGVFKGNGEVSISHLELVGATSTLIAAGRVELKVLLFRDAAHFG